MDLVLQGIDQVTLLEITIGNRVKVVVEKTNLILKLGEQVLLKVDQSRDEMKNVTHATGDEIANLLLDLFNQGERTKDARQAEVMRSLSDPNSAAATASLASTSGTVAMQQPWMPPQGMPPPSPSWMAPPPTGYYHPQPPPEPVMHVNALLEILNVSNLDTDDITSILESTESIALRYRSQAKNIITTDEFRARATSPTSCELLIQGDTGQDIVQAGSGLSLVSASLMQGLRNQDRFVSLVFFCRQHFESDDTFAGPGAMIRSLTAQLLQQHFADFTFRQRDVDLGGLRSGNVGVLCRLFEWFVRHIPQHKTLVCVVDGVEAYETAKFEADLRKVMDSLLDLARDPSLVPAVKVLATSPEGTVSLDEAFKKDDLSVLLIEVLLSRGDEESMLELEDKL
ncbi:uncharacterized protein PAC_17007 [Phialocephala subalpina]|uniref:Nephrocystin 3-like N-terminal domain-containing protein n=1 Tax=Phialocephala subalpina TaxID=576137 RepID=A0A1L7XQ66_9HELO|nr:uncharacterized protein PAC_17007 [Phialocephala subalpina]